MFHAVVFSVCFMFSINNSHGTHQLHRKIGEDGQNFYYYKYSKDQQIFKELEGTNAHCELANPLTSLLHCLWHQYIS